MYVNHLAHKLVIIYKCDKKISLHVLPLFVLKSRSTDAVICCGSFGTRWTRNSYASALPGSLAHRLRNASQPSVLWPHQCWAARTSTAHLEVQGVYTVDVIHSTFFSRGYFIIITSSWHYYCMTLLYTIMLFETHLWKTPVSSYIQSPKPTQHRTWQPHQLVNKLWQVEGELHHSNSGCGSSAIAAPWYQRKRSSVAYFRLWKSGSLLGDRSNWLTNAACLARTIWMPQRTVCFQFNLQKSMTPSIVVSITLWSVGDAEFVSNAK